jgi:hypothetical protein
MKYGIVLLPILLLSACASQPEIIRGDEFAAHSEKSILVALRETEASDEQRTKILALYDEQQPRRKKIDAESLALLVRWRALDRRDAAFAEQSQQLATEWADVNRRQMLESASFEQQVAPILSEDQWKIWQQFWSMWGGSDGMRGGPGRRMRR